MNSAQELKVRLYYMFAIHLFRTPPQAQKYGLFIGAI